MKSFLTFIILAFVSLSLFGFEDDSHYSVVFGSTRYFRVFTPPGYNASIFSKRYPVIYYFHGCGGSYKKSGTYSYNDFGLIPPVAVGRSYDSAYLYPDNAEFENATYYNDVIIICVDGKIDGLGGCGVYFPSQADSWTGNFYNFSEYIKELISVVDKRYNTKAEAQYRAVSGLSMGGHMAVWIAATNPDLFGSASEFCHSPTFYDVGDPSFQTTIDVKQLWRNLRSVPFRHSTNDRDYLRYYTEQLGYIFSGAGFENESYLADYCKHHAARIDLQVAFHIKHFNEPRRTLKCFSFINLYPDFNVWDYKITSSKTGNGWIYLHDVTENGMGIYTRGRLPWGYGLAPFSINVLTPALYMPNEVYTVSRYSYRDHSFSDENIYADSLGRLSLNSSGGPGEEIGISGKQLQPPVFILTDTVNENIYLDNNIETALSFDLINLSEYPQTVNFIFTTDNTDLLSLTEAYGQVTINPKSKKRVDSLVVCKGKYISALNNTGYLRIKSSVNGILQDRESIIQVTIKDNIHHNENFGVRIFDGRSDSLSLFKYKWGGWNNPVSADLISEGSGNANGKAEAGEIFSIWIQLPSGFDSKDLKTWHPVVPVNNESNPDISVVEIKQYSFNTGRNILSAQIKLNRSPTKKNPVRIHLQAELLKVEHLENACHRNTADNFTYSYYDVIINSKGIPTIINTLR